MNQDEYGLMVAALVKPGAQILLELTPAQANLLHMVVGISGEAGELLDAIKKHTVYQKELDIDNIIEELGDIEFYMEGLRRELLLTRAQCLAANHDKLRLKRYKTGVFSNEAAIDRADKLGEED